MANRIFFFLKMQFEGHRGLQPVCTIIYTIKKDKEKKQDTDRERGTAWFAPRGCTFLTYVQRGKKKKSVLTYKCKKTRLQTISTFIDYEEERKKESERNLQNKMQNLELQLHWL